MGTNSLLETPASQASVVEVGEMVREGAKLLDRVNPDWWMHIDPLKLEMGSCTACIAGQSGLDYEEANRTLGFTGWTGKPWDDESHIAGPFGDNPALVPHWLEEIASRMPDSARLDRSVVERATKPADGRVRSGGGQR